MEKGTAAAKQLHLHSGHQNILHVGEEEEEEEEKRLAFWEETGSLFLVRPLLPAMNGHNSHPVHMWPLFVSTLIDPNQTHRPLSSLLMTQL